MKIIKIILLNILLISGIQAQEIRYTKSGIPIIFYGLLDLDNVNYDTNGLDKDSLIYKIKMLEKHR
jgi:hypothetical protein